MELLLILSSPTTKLAEYSSAHSQNPWLVVCFIGAIVACLGLVVASQFIGSRPLKGK